MMKWILGGVAAALVGYFGYIAYYVGAFKPVHIQKIEAQTFYLAGKTHVGPYHKIVSLIEIIEKWAKENNIDCTRTFGLYSSDPSNTEEARLKSYGGCLLSQEVYEKYSKLSASSVPTTSNKSETANEEKPPIDIEFQTLNASGYVQADFSGSPGIGPMKVYPKVKSYIQENSLQHNGQVLERYTLIPGQPMTTTYFFVLK